MSYYIFGAHSRGRTLSAYLRKLHPDWEFKGYLYDNDEPNQETIEGFPVVKMTAGNPFNAEKTGNNGENSEEEIDFDAANTTVYVATRGIHHQGIVDRLKSYGFTEENIVLVGVELDNELRNQFVEQYFAEQGWDYCKLESFDFKNCETDSIVQSKSESVECNSINGDKTADKLDSTTIYVVRSAVDSPLSKEIALLPEERFIQAGRDLAKTDLSQCAFYDNSGDNISDKNRQFCELTAMYWIWKNAGDGYIGLEHYRRRFILPENWQRAMATGINNGKGDNNTCQYNVILPVPLYVAPSIEGNYLSRHLHEPWEAMLDALDRLYGCKDDAKKYFAETGCYSPCNMLIADRKTFDELCSWLFPILFEVQDKCGQYEDSYQNRYPGFLSERLITYFFYRNREKYSVVYCDKCFIP
ncbi:DUF4422 domain-containing protein [Butyrivibrio proteoclasticus]|uniref:DUF4422 domain-containing protein n=1 Tax=Butyrivibrio proteoclasticus TaxID=43305 RepID=UPI00054D80A0|nr:DUF4422 domain-containing protein [Butyrivibrio proteoclasticus]